MTEAEKRASRARRRATETPSRSRQFTSSVPLANTAEYVEDLRAQLIQRLTTLADMTDSQHLEASICFGLLRMTSLGRTRLDVTHALTADPAVADALRALSIEQLERLAAGLPLTGDGPVTAEDLAALPPSV